jgi:hypothetical protein
MSKRFAESPAVKLTRPKFFFLAASIWIGVMILVSSYPWLIGTWHNYQIMTHEQPGGFSEAQRTESLSVFWLICLHAVLQGMLSAAAFSYVKPRKTYALDSLVGTGISIAVACVVAMAILRYSNCCVPHTFFGGMALAFFYVIPFSPILGAGLGGLLVARLRFHTVSRPSIRPT